MRTVTMLIAGLMLALAGQPALAQDQSKDDNVVFVRSGDAAMAAAVKAARAGLPAFFDKLAKPGADEGRFSVKFNLAPKGDAEFIWASDLRRENGKLTGALAGQPLTKGFEAGQRVTIAEADIIDWAYFHGPVAQGHVTTKVILDQIGPEQATPVRRALGWLE